jgi:hypothetical protein
MPDDQEQEFEWAIVEIMGYHRCAGRIFEVERFGAKLLRVDIPTDDGGWATEFFGGSAIYRLRRCSEEIARSTAKGLGDPRPSPPHPPAAALTYRPAREPETDEDEDDGDEFAF